MPIIELLPQVCPFCDQNTCTCVREEITHERLMNFSRLLARSGDAFGSWLAEAAAEELVPSWWPEELTQEPGEDWAPFHYEPDWDLTEPEYDEQDDFERFPRPNDVPLNAEPV